MAVPLTRQCMLYSTSENSGAIPYMFLGGVSAPYWMGFES